MKIQILSTAFKGWGSLGLNLSKVDEEERLWLSIEGKLIIRNALGFIKNHLSFNFHLIKNLDDERLETILGRSFRGKNIKKVRRRNNDAS